MTFNWWMGYKSVVHIQNDIIFFWVLILCPYVAPYRTEGELQLVFVVTRRMMLIALHTSKENIYYDPNRGILCSQLKITCLSIGSNVVWTLWKQQLRERRIYLPDIMRSNTTLNAVRLEIQNRNWGGKWLAGFLCVSLSLSLSHPMSFCVSTSPTQLSLAKS